MFSFRNINLLKAFIRFPIACVFAIIATLIGMYIIDFPEPPTPYINVFLCCIIGGVSNIALVVSKESHQWSTSQYWLGILGILFFLVLLYFGFLPSSYEIFNTSLFRLPFQIASLILFLHLVISFVPFINKGSEEDFWEYNKDLFLNIVESGFYSFFLFAGLSIAILALDKLFGIDIDSLAYPRLLFFLVGIFNTLYFLSKYPTVYYDNQIKTPIKAFLIFSQYILIPLVLIYMTILYAYGLQIAFNWELPEGWVSQLSLWFSVVGIFAYLLNYFNYKFSDFKITDYYKKHFFLVLLLPIALVFIAIYRRISEYGITELRYVVALLGVWLLGVALYFNLSKSKNIRVIPISLSVFVLIPIILGPFSMFNATLSSQKKQFKQLLIDNGSLIDQELMPIKKSNLIPLTPESDRTIVDENLERGSVVYNAIRFLDNRSDLSFINEWIEPDLDFINENDPTVLTDSLDRYHNARILAEALDISSYIPTNYDRPKGTRFNFNQDVARSIEVESNKYFVPIDIHADRHGNSTIFFKMNDDKTGLELYQTDQLLGEILLNGHLEKLLDEQEPSDEKHTNYTLQEPIYKVENESFDATLIISNLGGVKSPGGEFILDNIWGHAIIELKSTEE